MFESKPREGRVMVLCAASADADIVRRQAIKRSLRQLAERLETEVGAVSVSPVLWDFRSRFMLVAELPMALALLWLPASETALITYIMPVWAAILAWPVLGEEPTALRTIGLVVAFAGLAALTGGDGFPGSMDKLPGIIMARCLRLCRRHGADEEIPDSPAVVSGGDLADRARLPAGRDRGIFARDRAVPEGDAARLGIAVPGSVFVSKACAGMSSHTSRISRPSRSFMLIRSTTCGDHIDKGARSCSPAGFDALSGG
jgi:EamA-like transporter family protein